MSAYRGPELLTANHTLERFDCGDEPLNDWLLRRALRNQGGGSSRTWVVTDGERVVAYYGSSTAALARTRCPAESDATNRIRCRRCSWVDWP